MGVPGDPIRVAQYPDGQLVTRNESMAIVQQQPGEMTIEQVVAQKRKVQELMKHLMKDGEHYGVIPGTGTKDKPGKPTLYKAGAEMLCFTFRLSQQFEVVDKTETDTKIAFVVRCKLTHITTGHLISEGLGSCNSREAKYLRAAPRKCPVCGKEAIIKGKEKFGGGWLCYKKKQGCGAKWDDGDPVIEEQPTEPADPSDLHNTILKMACKRSLTAAVLNGTAASDFFTQDLEDLAQQSPVSSAPETVKPAKVTESKVWLTPEAIKKIEDGWLTKDVTRHDLERFLGLKSLDDIDGVQVTVLKRLWVDIRDGKVKVTEAFGDDGEPPASEAKSRTDILADKVAKKAPPRTVNAEQDPSQAPVDYDTVPF